MRPRSPEIRFDSTRAAVLLLSALALAACTVEPLVLEGRRCPCIEGWRCDEARDLCVHESEGLDAGGVDAGRWDAGGMDAGSLDAGGVDAGSVDAGSVDAGPVDAGPVDAGGVDAGGVDAGAACPANGFWCDDFESGDLNQWTGRSVPLEATARAQDALAHSGTYAAHFTANGTASRSVILAEVIPIPNPPDVYYRAWYWLPASSVFIEFHNLINELTGNLLTFAGDTVYDVHSHDYAADFRQETGAPFPTDRWVCVELHVEVGLAGTVELYVDDNRVVAFNTDTRAQRGIATAETGIAFRTATADQPKELYVDDVVLATTPIGCTQ